MAKKDTITRTDAHQLLLIEATKRFDNAVSEQQRLQAEFTERYGSVERIDANLLNATQSLQMRFAAVAARQRAERNHYGTAKEPRVQKIVEQLGSIIGELTVYIASEQVEPLFRPVSREDYLGTEYERERGEVGRLGYNPAVLEGKTIIDEPRNVTSARQPALAKNAGSGEPVAA